MHRKSPLARRTALSPTDSLRRSAPLSRSRRVAVTARVDTGPDADTRRRVLRRDLYMCARCGVDASRAPLQIQHRLARGMGGTSNPRVNLDDNLVPLCIDCHDEVEFRERAQGHADGWVVFHGEDPAVRPVRHFRLGWVQPTAWGSYDNLPDDAEVGS